MRKEFKDSGFAKMRKILEGNGYECTRRGTRSFVYKRGDEVIMVPRSLCEKDLRSMMRKYNLA